MNESWCGWVTEVEEGQVEQVDDQQKLSRPEMASNPEHDETEDKKIVLCILSAPRSTKFSDNTHEDEVCAHIGRVCYEALIRAIEVSDIVSLQDQGDDPVDINNHTVQAERRWPSRILSPYCVTVVMVMVAIGGLCKGIVGTSNYDQEPRNDGEDFVGDEVARGKFLTLREWVVCRVC